ncbi:hypothetical protein [Syntrophomonas palmitatica]|uniref:hypothetical protein n=1 Tax=Syntrophomonas palmitatica TaxID=402877 RepID=UPI0006CF8F79|nr:hypothetical protein [Syntrophomonas palmitatica]
MQFNSYIFILAFLPFTLTAYYQLNKRGWTPLAKALLLVMSLVFYSYLNLSYLYIIGASIFLNYFFPGCCWTPGEPFPKKAAALYCHCFKPADTVLF